MAKMEKASIGIFDRDEPGAIFVLSNSNVSIILQPECLPLASIRLVSLRSCASLSHLATYSHHHLPVSS